MSSSSAPGPAPLNPILSMALRYLGSVSPETRQEWADIVCETLGVRPRFWLKESEGHTPPTNIQCAVKVGTHQNGVRVVLGTHDGKEWLSVADGKPLAEVQAFGFIPD